jgi:large subunit ribosomal protein L18
MSKTAEKSVLRERRKKRIRKKIGGGTAERPRLSVFRSDTHVYAQVIDDLKGVTLASVSSFEKGKHRRANIGVCEELGKTLAERCKAKNIGAVVFDKNGFAYHGRVKALADGARDGGLQF